MKKTLLFLFTLVLTFSFSATVKAQETTVVITNLTNRYNLPTTFVLGQDLPTYEYEGETIPDFRRYFEVSVNRDVVLNVHGANPVDKGGYEWNFSGFNINRLGQSAVILTYGDKFLRIVFQVVEFDEIPPFIYDPDRPTETTLPETFIIEAGTSIANQFVKFRMRDNIDDDRRLVILNADSTYSFVEEYFTGLEQLDDPELNTNYILTVRFEDSAGNEFSQTITLRIVDTTPPIIYNIPNIEITKGDLVNYKANLRLDDNYTKNLEDFIIVYDIVNNDNEVIGQEEDINNLSNMLGEHRIRLRVTDESNNTSTRVIRLVVKNPISIGEIILYINLIGLGVAGLGVGVFFIAKKKR